MSAVIAKSPSTTSPCTTEPANWPKSWNVLRQGLGVGRYIDPEFACLEFEKLWNRVWQVAARVDEIPQQGDYTTYKIGDQSILLVRVDESTVKAYYNFCPHRGTTLGDGCGHFNEGKIICPYHGWRWDLEGNIKMVLERKEFNNGQLQDSDVAMREVHSQVYAGFVFINLSDNPEPFDQFIAPMRQFLDDFVIGDMHHMWWKRAEIPCNWKVAQEAFYEAYHVSATHPQLEKVGSEVVYGNRDDGDMFFRHLTYTALENGHGYFYGGDKTPMAGHVQEKVVDANGLIEAMATRMNLTAEGLGAMIIKDDIDLLRSLKNKTFPADVNIGAEYVKLQYATAAELKRPMPKMTPEHLARWGGVNIIFPNILVLVQAGSAAIYRVLPHPTDPDKCTFEIRSVRTYPEAVKWEPSIAEEVTDPMQVGLIPRQDLSNLPRVQEGLHSKGMKQVWLAQNQEKLILNMHQELDRYLKS